MVSSYCDILKKQYQLARGISIFNNSKEENSEFIEWIKQQQKNKEYYQHYLLVSGLYYNESTSLEIGKGKYDTITSPDTRATLVTEYAQSFQKGNVPEMLFCGKIQATKDYQFVLTENKPNRNHTHVFFDNINLFYTQNPYSTQVLPTLAQIHNSGKSIVVGAFGNLDDKDRIAKIKQLKKVKELLIGEKYKEVYLYVNDSYIYFIHTNKTYSNKHRRKVYTLS